MATFTSPLAAENVGQGVETPKAQTKPDTRGLPNIRNRHVAHVPEQGSLPPIGVMLAHPLLLTICVILGGLAGFAAWGGGKGYQATATVEFTVGANDVALVELEGQTLAHRITTEPVIQRAATSVGQPATDIAANTTAKWQPQSLLVRVTAVAVSRDAAVARANAVAQAAVAVLSDSVSQRLGAANSEANSLLLGQPLADPDAEAARRSQVGASLGERQAALIAQSQSVSIARAANEATPAGLTKSMSMAIGCAAGLFAGCLIAVLLGTRGLRARSLGEVRRLAPGVDVLTPSQAPELAGRIVEAGDTYLAVLVTRRSSKVAEAFAANIERILSTHGRTVTTIRPPATVDETSAPLLRADAPNNVRSLVGTDVLVVILEARTESAAMLEGRSGFRTVILMRRYRTPVSDGFWAAHAYRDAMPVLMLAK